MVISSEGKSQSFLCGILIFSGGGQSNLLEKDIFIVSLREERREGVKEGSRIIKGGREGGNVSYL